MRTQTLMNELLASIKEVLENFFSPSAIIRYKLDKAFTCPCWHLDLGTSSLQNYEK